MKKNLKLINMFRLITVLALILLATIMVALNIYSNKVDFDQRSEILRNGYAKQQKGLVESEVKRADTLIEERWSTAEMENHIALLQKELMQQQSSQIQRAFFVTGLLIMIVLLLFYLIGKRLKKDLALCLGVFNLSAEDEERERDHICFEELYLVAENANIALEDKRVALRQMRFSEEKYRNLFDSALVGLFRSRLSDGLYIEANKKAASMFDSSYEEVIGKVKAIDLFRDLSQREKLLRELEEKGQVDDFEVDFILPNGKPASFSVSVKAYPEKGYMEGISIDISDRKRAEKLLKESEEQFRELADLLPVAVYEIGMDHNITYANQCAYKLFGYTEDDLARGVKGLEIFVPEERARVSENIAAVHRGEDVGGVEYLALKKDGSKFPVLATASPIIKDGKLCGRRGVVIDLSERKQTEEEILKLRKLESVGLLAGGIAHDFNNLLAGLFGNIELAKRFLSDQSKAVKYLESAEMSMERATGLTRQLLTFAKGGDPLKEVFLISDMIVEVAEFSLRGSNVKLELDIDGNLWKLNADKGQLSQVISNLVINAKQAMPSGGTVTVRAANIETSGVKQIKIEVCDQGIGISPQHLDKVFDPYFSTKQQGSGLGLASCYSIVHKHEGTIVVESELNVGTKFTLTFPAIEDTKPSLDTAFNFSLSTDSIVSALRILILDDEKFILDMCSDMLEYMGHQVDCVTSGEEAVSLYLRAREHSRGYDIVICDLTIPGDIGGQEVAREIIRNDPGAKIIVSSGYATDPVMANYEKYGFRGRVAKPFCMDELKKEVERVNLTPED
jgi:PAS domain S-box-containing protein